MNGPLLRFANLVSTHDRALERQRILRILRRHMDGSSDDPYTVEYCIDATLQRCIDAIKEAQQ